MLGFSQEHHVDPLDSTFLHQASSNDATFDEDSDVVVKRVLKS